MVSSRMIWVVIFFFLAALTVFSNAIWAQGFDGEYERRAQEVVTGLAGLNGLRGWTPQAPATWPVSLVDARGEQVSVRSGRHGGVRWNQQAPAGLISLNLTGQNLQRAADLSGLSFLEHLELSGNSLKAINLAGSTALTRLVVVKNQLAALNIENCPRLIYLAASGNHLVTLNLSANIQLTDIYLSANQLTELDVSRQSGLVNLDVMNNRLTDISVRVNPDLEKLLISYNQLQNIDVSANQRLVNLGVRDNNLTELSLSANTRLAELTVSRNNLQKLDLRANSQLTRLSAEQNQLAVLDLSGLTKLEHLALQRNPLTDIILGDNALENLISLNLDDCQLPLSRLAFWAGLAKNRARLGSQKDVLFVKSSLLAGETLDLSAEAEIGGSKTIFLVQTDKGRRVKQAEYEENSGQIVFHRPGFYRVMMSNEKVFSSEINRTTGQMRTLPVKVYTGIIEVKPENQTEN